MSRRITEEEEQDWKEANKHTRVKKTKKLPALPPLSKEPPAMAPATKMPPPMARPTKKQAPLVPLPKRDADRLFKPHARIEARIDLHGMTQDEAHAALIRFVTRAHESGKRHVAVITGKGSRGEGVLKRAVPRWLELPELRGKISAIRHAPPEKGGEGVLHLLLKKP
jgi:DNA-nicking Smr family endonuclease